MRYLIFATGPQGLGRRGGELRHRLAVLLSGEVSERVEVLAVESYGELLRTVEKGTASIAWLPPALYVAARDRGHAQLLCRSVRHDATSYRGTLFSLMTSLVDADALRGAHIGWVDPDSCAGHLFPRITLADRGVSIDEVAAEQSFLGSHGAVARAVINGDVDVGATFVHVDADDCVLHAGWTAIDPSARMRRLLTTAPVPSDTICASKSLDEALVPTFQKALLSLSKMSAGAEVLHGLFQSASFVEAGDVEDYETVRRARRLVAS